MKMKITTNYISEHLEILKKWLHSGAIEKPTQGQLESLSLAIELLHEQATKYESYEQPIAILSYHVKYPGAELFRDPVTIKTVKTAISAYERKLGRRY